MNLNHKPICSRTYLKDGKVWKETMNCNEYDIVIRWLLSDLIAKKLNECRYISRITNKYNYDGTRTITVYYYDTNKHITNAKREYTIPTDLSLLTVDF